MIRITDIAVPLRYDSGLILKLAAQRLRIEPERIHSLRIAKRAVNARNQQDVHFVLTVFVTVQGSEAQVLRRVHDRTVRAQESLEYTVPKGKPLGHRPVIVGSGPAGLFAALILAQAGAMPILLERGYDVDRRKQAVLDFWNTGVLNTECNVQFGEGGAGTFSDGKLKVGGMDPLKWKILNEFVQAGAPEEILFEGKPHIGTDRLSRTVKGIREKIISLGGEVRFCATLTGLIKADGRIRGIRYTEHGTERELACDHVVLAIGHSARDTFRMLHQSGIFMEQKPFAVGIRIEHLQEKINVLRYGAFAGHLSLHAADYGMVAHLPDGRGVYTFCMCPGGTVVAAASEENRVVTNGMSEFLRDGINANSAIIVTVGAEDYGSADPLAGVQYQRKIESAAFAAGGGGYRAPVQRLEDFLSGRNSSAFGEVLPTYRPGTAFAPADSYLPAPIAESLRQGLLEMGNWMPGYLDPDALITGAETRSSSPVRITRGETMESIGTRGLYPCGEGAGYAGGILSAAIDGIRCAEQILNA